MRGEGKDYSHEFYTFLGTPPPEHTLLNAEESREKRIPSRRTYNTPFRFFYFYYRMVL